MYGTLLNIKYRTFKHLFKFRKKMQIREEINKLAFTHVINDLMDRYNKVDCG